MLRLPNLQTNTMTKLPVTSVPCHSSESGNLYRSSIPYPTHFPAGFQDWEALDPRSGYATAWTVWTLHVNFMNSQYNLYAYVIGETFMKTNYFNNYMFLCKNLL